MLSRISIALLDVCYAPWCALEGGLDNDVDHCFKRMAFPENEHCGGSSVCIRAFR